MAFDSGVVIREHFGEGLNILLARDNRQATPEAGKRSEYYEMKGYICVMDND